MLEEMMEEKDQVLHSVVMMTTVAKSRRSSSHSFASNNKASIGYYDTSSGPMLSSPTVHTVRNIR